MTPTIQTVRDFFDSHYLPEYLSRCTPQTVTKYRTHLAPFDRFVGCGATLADLTIDNFVAFLRWLQSEGYSTVYSRSAYWTLRAVWAHAAELGLAEPAPKGRPRGRNRKRHDNATLTQDIDDWSAALAPKGQPHGLVASVRSFLGIAKPTRDLRTLGGFIDAYIDSRTDVKPATRDLMRQGRRFLVACLGERKPLADITPGDADDFRRHVMQEIGENTARRMCGRAKQFFRAAVRKKLIPESPFADMGGNSARPNKARQFYVTREAAERILSKCPDAEWRLLFALSRFGGLRCPSEHMALDWSDVDWNRNRLRVPSPKTEHHPGKSFRWIPLFPELRTHLVEAYTLAGSPTAGLIFADSKYRRPGITRAGRNLRTRLNQLIRKAGLEPWPKLFHNLRATRETELAQSYPLHVVCEWIGNSAIIAAKHYLQVTDSDFDRAAAPGGAA